MQEAIALSLAALSLATEKDEGSSTDAGLENKQTSSDESITPGPEFESEQEMLDYALAMSLEESVDEQHEKENSPASHEKVQNTAQNGHPRSCDTCKRYPRFPAFKKPTKFRILQFDPEDLSHTRLCDHYAAVSYCWRSDNTGTSAAAEKSYRIRVQDQDGSYIERNNRTPIEIIDRAVDGARVAGFRLICIDQECLPQDDSREQELGIQAMDMVYQRAQLTIGLLESTIQKQVHLDAAASVLYWGVRREKDPKAVLAQRRPGVPLQEFCLNLLEFLELLADDLWNSRAWILQEAFSSAEDLALFIRTAPDVGFHSPPENVFDKGGDPNWVKGSFSIWVRDVLKLIRISKKFLISGVVKPEEYSEEYMNSLVERGNAHTADWYGRAVEVLQRLDRLFPVPAATTNRHAFMFAVGGSNFGPRKTCNAAVALYFLRTRLNHRPADRLAILANLCDYEIRLDTTEIEKRFTSLSACLATLAIINGDLSLLVPGVYENFLIQAPIEGPSWALPFPEILHSVNVTTLRAGYNLTLRNSNRYSPSKSGLILPAALWNVNRMVDLTPVKLQWQSEWKKFTCLEVEVSWLPHETPEEHQARHEEVIRQVQEDYMRTDPSKRGWKSERYEWDFEPDPKLGANVWRVVSADHANGIPQLQALIGRIFVDILGYLYHTGEASLANSIWHSIRMDCASVNSNSRFKWGDSNLNALPDTVEELLGNRELISNLSLALQLDANDRGNLSQMWLVHRIMKHGFLWVGNYTTTSSTTHSYTPFERPPNPRPHILQSQTSQQLMAFELKKHIHEIERNDLEAADEGVTLGWSVAVMYKSSLEEYSWEREARFRHQVAAFDADGPCLVATPYDSDMERLPRPSVRSMACAWAVEPVGKDNVCKLNQLNGEEDLQTADKSTPPPDVSPSSGVIEKDEADLKLEEVPDADLSNGVRLDKGKGKMKESVSEEGESSSVVHECERFKVVRRVMGVWEIMEEPTNRYTFV